jgi:hypothetical protein
MLKDNIRQCDVCNGLIPKGEKYRVSTVTKDQALLFRSLIEASEPELAPTTTVDSQGNMRLDICLECHLNIGAKGTETVH